MKDNMPQYFHVLAKPTGVICNSEWQAIMDHLRNLPVKSKGELPVIPVDERAAEVRAIKGN